MVFDSARRLETLSPERERRGLLSRVCGGIDCFLPRLLKTHAGTRAHGHHSLLRSVWHETRFVPTRCRAPATTHRDRNYVLRGGFEKSFRGRDPRSGRGTRGLCLRARVCVCVVWYFIDVIVLYANNSATGTRHETIDGSIGRSHRNGVCVPTGNNTRVGGMQRPRHSSLL